LSLSVLLRRQWYWIPGMANRVELEVELEKVKIFSQIFFKKQNASNF
jgi:hypothetical protein